nr:type II toxin-antitoxin system RelE/ParE family toxin [Martelella limonii]
MISAAASSRSGSTKTCIGPSFWQRPVSSHVFAYLFAKKDRANIDDDELAAFRKLAELYRRKTTADLEAELGIGALLEIDHGD